MGGLLKPSVGVCDVHEMDFPSNTHVHTHTRMHTVAELGSGPGWGPTLRALPARVGLSTVVLPTEAQRLSEARAASPKCGPRSNFISAAVTRTGPHHPCFLLPQNPGNDISQHPPHWGWGLGLSKGRVSHRAWARLPLLRRP